MKIKDKPFYISYQSENKRRLYCKKRKRERHNLKKQLLKSKLNIFTVFKGKTFNRKLKSKTKNFPKFNKEILNRKKKSIQNVY